MLCWNLYTKADGKKTPFTRDYIVLTGEAKSAAGNVRTVRVAVFGYVNDFPDSVTKSRFEDYEIHEEDLRDIENKAAEMKASGEADAAILPCHVSPENMDLLIGETTAFDLILCGHDHGTDFGALHNGGPYMCGASHAEGYARAELAFGDGGTRVAGQAYISVTDDPAALYDAPENADRFDPEVLNISRAAIRRVYDEYPDVAKVLG